MLDFAERQFVEAIRDAKSVRIIINEGTDDERGFFVEEKRHDIRQFRRNVRYAIQDYLNECHRKLQRHNFQAIQEVEK